MKIIIVSDLIITHIGGRGLNITLDFLFEISFNRSVFIYPEVAKHHKWSFLFQRAICIFHLKIDEINFQKIANFCSREQFVFSHLKID